MRLFILSLFFTLTLIFSLEAGEVESLPLQANACEKPIDGESLASTRIRASDKAVFLSLKNLSVFDEEKKRLNEHDLNVMIYRLVDEFVEDLNVKVVKQNQDKVCVEINGFVNPKNIDTVRAEFRNLQFDNTEEYAPEVAQTIKQDIALRPQNPENLALVFVENLQYYNGAVSEKYTLFLKNLLKNNPYFYVTEEKELADYIITPKVLKAKVEALDTTHKRLQMVVVLETSGLENEIVSKHQNRFILFSVEENEQDIASRLIKKLLDQASKDVVRLIEHKEQIKLETQAIGHSISE